MNIVQYPVELTAVPLSSSIKMTKKLVTWCNSTLRLENLEESCYEV